MAGRRQQQEEQRQGQPVVLITGCTTGGIGHALALELAARRCRVYGTARRPDAAGGLAEAGVGVLPLDVTDADACAAAVDRVVADAGRLDILVNNAGVVTLGPSCEVPMSLVRSAFDANVFGLLQMCQAAHRHMVAQGGGKIINIASLTGLQPVPLRGVYSATKGAVVRLSDALRIELAPFGVQVCVVAPGFIDTHARDNARQHNCAPRASPLWGRWLEALDAASAPLLDNAVPVDAYAKQLASLALQERLPRCWIGRCAGIEWLPRFLPGWLQDRVLAQRLGITSLAGQMAAGAAALRLDRERATGQGGGQE